MIDGYKSYNSLKINEQDRKDFDEILYNEESILVIKRYTNFEDFSKNWSETVHFTAGYIQSNLEEQGFNSSYAWNIYIIYVINFDVDFNYKNSIEKNKYCCKKYVVDVRGFKNTTDALLSKIPVLAKLDFATINQENFELNDSTIKSKITSITDSIASKYFLNTNEVELIDSNKILNYLKEVYNKHEVGKN